MSEQQPDFGPATTIGRTIDPRHLPTFVAANTNEYEGVQPLPQRTTQDALGRILAQPAPLPHRIAEAVQRERLEGASEKSTPITRAVASFIRSGKYLLVVAFVGIVSYVAVPTVSGLTVFFYTLLAMGLVMLGFDLLEYQHSQPGVERLRSKFDHILELDHERNRHVETMAAIQGDTQIKLRVLALGEQYARLADKRGGQ